MHNWLCQLGAIQKQDRPIIKRHHRKCVHVGHRVTKCCMIHIHDCACPWQNHSVDCSVEVLCNWIVAAVWPLDVHVLYSGCVVYGWWGVTYIWFPGLIRMQATPVWASTTVHGSVVLAWTAWNAHVPYHGFHPSSKVYPVACAAI